MAIVAAGCSGDRHAPEAAAPTVAQSEDPSPDPAAAVRVPDPPKSEPGVATAEIATAEVPAVVDAEPGRLDAPERKLPASYLGFSRACERGTRSITIAAVGDLLLHPELQRQAFEHPDRYRVLWASVETALARADVTYANLEGPTAYGLNRKREEVPDPGLKFDNRVYTGYARFNYHPSLGEDLLASGIDIVSTANNHSLDRGPVGVDRTLEALDKAKLPYTGTRRQGDTKAPWHVVTQVDGIAIAWLACTLHTNYEKDELGQVLSCFDDPAEVPRLVRALAKRSDVDAVIVTPHWGREYEHEPRKKERDFATAVIEAGALAVIGSHPHVLQPWERVQTSDGREALVMYSLGNFASHQQDLPKRSSIILYVGLTQGGDGEVFLNGARYLPITVRMEGDKDKYFVEPVDRRKGPAEVYEHVISLMGAPNSMAPDDVLRTNPECYAEWKPRRH